MTLPPYSEPNKICLTFLKSGVKVSTKLCWPLPANIKSTACFQVGQVKHMPDVIYDTNGKLSVGSYHMWRLYPTRITTRLYCQSFNTTLTLFSPWPRMISNFLLFYWFIYTPCLCLLPSLSSSGFSTTHAHERKHSLRPGV